MQKIRILGLLAGGVLLAACGGGDNEAREKKIEAEAAKHGVNADVELDEKGEVKSVAINNGLGGAVGNNLDLPAGFPADVPVADDWSVMASSAVPQDGFMLQATTGDNVDDTLAAIRASMTAAGWTEENADQPNAMMSRVGFGKGDRMTTFSLMSTGGPLTVQLVTMTRP